jgi:hypothetical protein
VKYAYQESPHSKNTASPRCEKEERKREHVFIRISISNKTPQTINEKEKPWGYRIGTVRTLLVKQFNVSQVVTPVVPFLE